MAATRARRGQAGPARSVVPDQLPAGTADPKARALPAPGCPASEDELAALKQAALKTAVPRSTVAQADGARRPKR
jgi:hypothetical protein